MCACVCTRLCTSVCAHVYTLSSWGTPATTTVLCGCVRCHPIDNNLLPFLPCCVFMLSHSNSRQQEEKLDFWTKRKESLHGRTVEYMSNTYTMYVINMLCYYFRGVHLEPKSNPQHQCTYCNSIPVGTVRKCF